MLHTEQVVYGKDNLVLNSLDTIFDCISKSKYSIAEKMVSIHFSKHKNLMKAVQGASQEQTNFKLFLEFSFVVDSLFRKQTWGYHKYSAVKPMAKVDQDLSKNSDSIVINVYNHAICSVIPHVVYHPETCDTTYLKKVIYKDMDISLIRGSFYQKEECMRLKIPKKEIKSDTIRGTYLWVHPKTGKDKCQSFMVDVKDVR